MYKIEDKMVEMYSKTYETDGPNVNSVITVNAASKNILMSHMPSFMSLTCLFLGKISTNTKKCSTTKANISTVVLFCAMHSD